MKSISATLDAASLPKRQPLWMPVRNCSKGMPLIASSGRTRLSLRSLLIAYFVALMIAGVLADYLIGLDVFRSLVKAGIKGRTAA